MKTAEKIKLINRGYGFALYAPIEFMTALKQKLTELENGNNPERWKAISKGYELALEERLNQRKAELTKAKQGKDISRSR